MNDIVTRLSTALSDRYRIERELGASGTFVSYDERLRDAASREGFDTP